MLFRSAELFNELYRWVRADWKKIKQATNSYREAEKYYDVACDFLKAAHKAWGDTWANDAYMTTKPVTIKAMIRVCADLAREDADPADGRQKRWEQRLSVWADQQKAFRIEGFYERFPAKGEVERVARIHRDLAKIAGIEVRSSAKAGDK